MPLQSLVDGCRSYFHIRMAGEPFNQSYAISDEYLTLMGAYVSEGSINKRLTDGTASVVKISQKNIC